MARIDIAIPCYNYAHFLPECIGSVLSQDIDVRVVIIDNASSDGSAEVARELAAQDRRIEVICHETNVGPNASFNEAIDLARAEYFLILCADDLLTPDTLRHGLAFLDANPKAAFALGANADMWQGGELPRQQGGGMLMDGAAFIERSSLAMGNGIPAHALLARTTAQKAAGYYRASLPFCDDLELALRLALAGDVAELAMPIAVRRIHSSNLSASTWNDRLLVLREREKAFESFFANEGASMPNRPRLNRIVKQRLGEAAYWSALSHFARRRAPEGTELLRFALSLNPKSRFFPPLGHLYRTEGVARRVGAIASFNLGVAKRVEGRQ